MVDRTGIRRGNIKRDSIKRELTKIFKVQEVVESYDRTRPLGTRYMEEAEYL